MRLIDKDKARKAILALVGEQEVLKYVDQVGRTRGNDHYIDAIIDADDVLDDMPTEDAEPVKYGYWIYRKMHNEELEQEVTYIECSECAHTPYYGGSEPMNYCPNCGAKMKRTRIKCEDCDHFAQLILWKNNHPDYEHPRTCCTLFANEHDIHETFADSCCEMWVEKESENEKDDL